MTGINTPLSTNGFTPTNDICRNPHCDYYIRVYTHRPRKSNGTGGLSDGDVINTITKLNSSFNPHGIFFIWGGVSAIINLDSDVLYDGIPDWVLIPPSNPNIILPTITRHSDGIDLFLFDGHLTTGSAGNTIPAPLPGHSEPWAGEAEWSKGGLGGLFFTVTHGTALFVAGYSSSVYSNNNPFQQFATSSAICHEMGHCLGLHHTFNIDLIEESNGIIVGGVDGAGTTGDEAYTGDLCSDTPESPYPGNPNNVNINCAWLGDPTYSPNTYNFMEYSRCSNEFSPQQVARMKNSLSKYCDLQACLIENPDLEALAPLFSAYNFVTTISTNTTWTSDKEIFCLRVEAGKTLTINPGVTVRFREYGKMIIERGATVIVNGATLTADCSWKGIDILGTNTGTNIATLTAPNQYTPGAQGKVILINGAAIKNAEDAIEVGLANDINMSGGIVYATDAFFINNRRDVVFYPFRNTGVSSNEERDNVSYFKNCDFLATTFDPTTNNAVDYPFPQVLERVSLYRVLGIKFEGCRFEIDTYIPYFAENTWIGIKSLDAGFSVLPYCTQTNVPIGNAPCPQNNTILSAFTNFYYGIDAANSGSSYSFRVENTNFKENIVRGILAKGVKDIRIINNRFQLSNNSNNYTSYGALLLGCARYHIEENLFNRSGGAGNVGGIGIIASGTDENEIYKNTFQSLTYGNASAWTNRDAGGNAAAGLQYLCNTHTGNDYDIAVTDGEGIRYYQGKPEPIQTESTPDGNTFSLNASTEGNYFNISNNPILRYYKSSVPNSQAIEFTTGWVTQISVDNINVCPSQINKDDPKIPQMERSATISDFNLHQNEYQTFQYLYANLIDGGNTQAVITDISTEWSDDAWQMRNELMALSPNVSREALLEAANTGVLPDALLFEVLMANRASCRDRDFMTKLTNSIPNPLPQYMIDWLVNAPEIASIRKEIEVQLAAHSSQLAQNIGILITDILADTTLNLDSLAYWIGQLHTPHAQYSLVDVLIEKGEYAAAQSILAAMPTSFAYVERHNIEHQSFVDFADLKTALAETDRTWKDLTENEIAEVQAIAATEGLGAIQAQSVLCFVLGDCPDIDINITPPASLRHQHAAIPAQAPSFSPCTAYPNPAKEFVVFEYSLPLNAINSYVEITDISGKTIQQISLSSNEKQAIWDTQTVPNGIYLYSLWVDGERSTTNKITIQK